MPGARQSAQVPEGDLHRPLSHNEASQASSAGSSRHAGFRGGKPMVAGSHSFIAASFIRTVISAYRFVVSRLTCPSTRGSHSPRRWLPGDGRPLCAETHGVLCGARAIARSRSIQGERRAAARACRCRIGSMDAPQLTRTRAHLDRCCARPGVAGAARARFPSRVDTCAAKRTGSELLQPTANSLGRRA